MLRLQIHPTLLEFASLLLSWCEQTRLKYERCITAQRCTAEVAYTLLPWPAGDLFTPLLFLLFNVGDLLGRLLSGVGAYVHKSPPASLLMGYALSRIALAAALVFCHVVTPHAWRAPELFR